MMWSGHRGQAACRAAARRAFLAPRHQLRAGRGPRPAAAVSRRRIRVWARAQRDCAAAALWPQHGDTAELCWHSSSSLSSVSSVASAGCWLPLVRGDARPGCLLSALQLHPPLSHRNTTLCLSSDAMYRVRISRYLQR